MVLQVLQPICVEQTVGEGEVSTLLAGTSATQWVIVHTRNRAKLGSGGTASGGIIVFRNDQIIIREQRIRSNEFVLNRSGHRGKLGQLGRVARAKNFEQFLRFTTIERERAATVITVHDGCTTVAVLT